MCIFSGPVHVEGTKIFARTDGSGWQGIVYEMQYTSDAPVAMVLPVPITHEPSTQNGGVPLTFVDLSGYPLFFAHLARGFLGLQPQSKGLRPAAQAQSLPVERVGSFEASFVPNVADFARLDRRFQLDKDVWRSLPQYADWGFAVFQLAPDAHALAHPMAFLFRTRMPDKVFFPTLHVHDGTVPHSAMFDHKLYAQSAAHLDFWEESDAPASQFMRIDQAKRLVKASALVHMRSIRGAQRNDDVIVAA